MKKLLFIAVITFFTSATLSAQGVKFGITGGLLNTNADISISALGFDIANFKVAKGTGFYIGAIVDIEATDKLHIQPEVTYGSAGDLAYVYVPIMLKYYVVSKLNIQVGPQFTFSSNLSEIKGAIKDIEGVLGSNGNVDDVLKSLGVDIGFGAGFDITDNFSVQARYAIEMTNRYSGPLSNSLKIKSSTLNIGIAYFF
ncbi:MAG: outer membrane beta-barrel protein [Cellulophaga sp.]